LNNYQICMTEATRLSKEGIQGRGSGSRTQKVLGGIITGVFILIFLGAPIFFTGVSSQGIVFDKYIFFYATILLGMVAWVTQGVLSGSMRIRRTPIDIPLALFWVWYGITAVFSVDRWHSFMGSFGDPSRGFVAVTFFILAFYFVVSHATESRVRKALSGMLIAGAFIVVWTALAVMDILFLPDAVKRLMPASFMGTFSSLAVYFTALVPLFITGLFIKAEESISSWWKKITYYGLYVVLVLNLFLLFALFSFVSWIAVLITIALFVIYIVAQLIRPSTKVSWVPTAAFVTILGFLMVGQMSVVRVNLPVEVSPTLKLSAQVAEKSVGKEWFTGVGPANYSYVFSMYKPDEFNKNELYTMRFGQSNSLFLEVLATTGIVGFLLFALTWLIFLGSGLYLLTYNAKGTNKIVSLGLWSIVFLFFVTSIFVTLGGILLLVLVPLSALAYVVLHKESASEERYVNFSLQASPKYALALAFTFMVVSAGVVYLFIFMGKVYAADVWARKSEIASGQGNREAALTALTSALSLNSNESRYYLRAAEEYGALANQEASRGQEIDQAKLSAALQQSVRAGEVAAQLSGNDVVVVEALALVYENALRYANDAGTRTEELYQRASTLEPINPLYLVKQGELKRNIGDTKKGEEQLALYQQAIALFDQALQKKENLGVAYYQKALVYSRQGEFDKALEAMNKAVQMEPGNVSYRYALGALHELRKKEGDVNIAIEIYKSILTAYPNVIDVRLALALAYEKQNNREAAINEYQQALELSDRVNSQDKERIKAEIGKLLDIVRSGGSNIQNSTAPTVDTSSTSDESNNATKEESEAVRDTESGSSSPITAEGLTPVQ
jgi:Flp pilus assembly protein TadD